MYFKNENHEENFKYLTESVFPYSENDVEYRSMCYIMALPEIFVRCITDPLFKDFPFLWIVDYVDRTTVVQDDGGEVKHLDFETIKDSDGIEVDSEKYNSLSYGYKLVLELGQNLFNSSQNDFNLTKSFNAWDESLMNCFYQVLEIRFGMIVS